MSRFKDLDTKIELQGRLFTSNNEDVIHIGTLCNLLDVKPKHSCPVINALQNLQPYQQLDLQWIIIRTLHSMSSGHQDVLSTIIKLICSWKLWMLASRLALLAGWYFQSCFGFKDFDRTKSNKEFFHYELLLGPGKYLEFLFSREQDTSMFLTLPTRVKCSISCLMTIIVLYTVFDITAYININKENSSLCTLIGLVVDLVHHINTKLMVTITDPHFPTFKTLFENLKEQLLRALYKFELFSQERNSVAFPLITASDLLAQWFSSGIALATFNSYVYSYFLPFQVLSISLVGRSGVCPEENPDDTTIYRNI
ncbi:hypothetical protein C8R43DRAFT_961095 [Mycena crocata]|nr:hypothetical protein C8R43DRAFT_961095 [Mycena crocata]